MTADPVIEGPAWDLATEYPSTDSERVDENLAELDTLYDGIDTLNRTLCEALESSEFDDGAVPADIIRIAREVHVLQREARRLKGNLDVFVRCQLSVDARDADAQNLASRLESYSKRGAQVSLPLQQFLIRIPDSAAASFLDDEETRDAKYLVERERNRRHELLSLPEERLVSSLAQDGILAWGKLYDQIAGTARVEFVENGESRTMGLAEASSRMQHRDPAVRERAWRAINDTWRTHEESCAAAVNAIAGWRLELCRRRSASRDVHFLDAPLHMNRISGQVLDALLEATAEARPLAQRAARAMARATGRDRIGPWDNRAPGPESPQKGQPVAFPDAIALIADACAGVDPALADFVRRAEKENWIEGRVAPSKRPGAYCTMFPLSRTPRVYMSYAGTPSDIITLAHELGHAYHGWMLRDFPDERRTYGMCVAETASTFMETVVRDHLLSGVDDPTEALGIAWEEITVVVTFLLNIPTRFEFEKAFYERRQGGPVRPDDLSDLMADAWINWYGDSLSEPDPMFWASKLHFYISGLSFYNFPYLFGFLFSTAVHRATRDWGEEAFARYNALLKDTGSMDAEPLAGKHLNAALADPGFWQQVIGSLEDPIGRFEALVDQASTRPASL